MMTDAGSVSVLSGVLPDARVNAGTVTAGYVVEKAVKEKARVLAPFPDKHWIQGDSVSSHVHPVK